MPRKAKTNDTVILTAEKIQQLKPNDVVDNKAKQVELPITAAKKAVDEATKVKPKPKVEKPKEPPILDQEEIMKQVKATAKQIQSRYMDLEKQLVETHTKEMKDVKNLTIEHPLSVKLHEALTALYIDQQVALNEASVAAMAKSKRNKATAAFNLKLEAGEIASTCNKLAFAKVEKNIDSYANGTSKDIEKPKTDIKDEVNKMPENKTKDSTTDKPKETAVTTKPKAKQESSKIQLPKKSIFTLVSEIEDKENQHRYDAIYDLAKAILI